MQELSFEAWLAAVDKHVQGITGLGRLDFNDWEYWDAWDAEMPPEEAAYAMLEQDDIGSQMLALWLEDNT